jgi:hypothetical protein
MTVSCGTIVPTQVRCQTSRAEEDQLETWRMNVSRSLSFSTGLADMSGLPVILVHLMLSYDESLRGMLARYSSEAFRSKQQNLCQ